MVSKIGKQYRIFNACRNWIGACYELCRSASFRAESAFVVLYFVVLYGGKDLPFIKRSGYFQLSVWMRCSTSFERNAITGASESAFGDALK